MGADGLDLDVSRHDPDDYGNFAKYQLDSDGAFTRLVCEDCVNTPERPTGLILEWQVMPVNLADVVKAASKHEVEMDRAPVEAIDPVEVEGGYRCPECHATDPRAHRMDCTVGRRQ